MLSPLEVRARAVKLERELRARNLREYVTAGLMTTGCGVVALAATDTVLTRIACAAGALSTLSICSRVAREGSRACPAHLDAAEDTWRACLRDALVRQRDLLARAWLWYVLPLAGTMALFLVAAYVELYSPLEVTAIGAGVCALLSVAVVYVNRAAAKKMQKELEAIDAPSE